LLGEGFPADEEVVGRLAFEDEFHGALTHLRVDGVFGSPQRAARARPRRTIPVNVGGTSAGC
jgi:hypothetical protein